VELNNKTILKIYVFSLICSSRRKRSHYECAIMMSLDYYYSYHNWSVYNCKRC